MLNKSQTDVTVDLQRACQASTPSPAVVYCWMTHFCVEILQSKTSRIKGGGGEDDTPVKARHMSNYSKDCQNT